MRNQVTVITVLGQLLFYVVLTIGHLGCGGSSASTAPPISVTVSPASATVQANGTQQFTATVSSDPTNSGVAWTLTQSGSACSPGCGTIAPSTTASGVPTTYTAPTTKAADLSVTITAASMASGSAIADAIITVTGITVSVNPSYSEVQVDAKQQFTATVSNDPTNSGVAWTLTQSGSACSPGCGTIAPSTTASGVPTTYTAPATIPPSDLTLMLTATSLKLSAVSGSATITVPAITVSVTPASALIPTGITQPFTATVESDPKNQGVAWTLTQGGTACSPAYGSVSPSTTGSGTPTSYTAPRKMPATSAVTLTATSVTDGTKTATAAITLSTGTVQLVPDSLDFGWGGKGNPQSVTLTNTGSSALSITSIKITGAIAGDFSQTNTCGSSVGSGLSCAITVTFKPPMWGSYAARISISDSSTDSPQQVRLSGTEKHRGMTDIAAVRSALASAGTVAVPIPTGTETVGTRVLQLVDSTRQDPFLANGAKRELLVRFWYPASLTQACKQAEYTSPRVWAYFSQLAGVHLPEVITNSCADAPMTDGVHPMVVFTHGYTGTFTDYTFLFEDLASRGYVVASVDHTYEATAVEFPDGRFVKSRLGSHLGNIWRGDGTTLTLATLVRLQDLRFVVSELERLNIKANDPLAGKLDVSRTAIAGHSLGGTTAFLALAQDARFRAAIVLDGYLPAALIHPTLMPVLVLSTGHMDGSADQCSLWNSLRGPRLSVNLSGAEHVAPSDAVWLAKGAIQTGSMGPERTVAAIRDNVAAFLDTNVRGGSLNPMLTEPSAAGVEEDSPCRQP